MIFHNPINAGWRAFAENVYREIAAEQDGGLSVEDVRIGFMCGAAFGFQLMQDQAKGHPEIIACIKSEIDAFEARVFAEAEEEARQERQRQQFQAWLR